MKFPSKKQIVSLLSLSVLIFISGCVQQPTPPKDTEATTDSVSSLLKVHFIDVDQGDATLIQFNDYNILIDAGKNNQGDRVVDYLKSVDVDDLYYVIGTHPDADHVGGLDTVIDYFDVRYIMDAGYEHDTKTYEDYIASINREVENGNTIFYEDDEELIIDLGEGVYLQIFDTGDEFSNHNDLSIVTYLVYNEIEFFLAADMEQTAEEAFISRVKQDGLRIEADVLKAGHHGSRTSSSVELLDLIQPEYITISAGEGNTYGHPHEEVLERFQRYTTDVYVTYEACPLEDDLCAIVVSTDGETIQIASEPVTLPEAETPEFTNDGLSFIDFPTTFQSGSVTFSLQGEPNVLYDITLTLPSGTVSQSSVFEPKVSNQDGVVSWTYTFKTDWVKGSGEVLITNVSTGEELIGHYQFTD